MYTWQTGYCLNSSKEKEIKNSSFTQKANWLKGPMASLTRDVTFHYFILFFSKGC